MPGRFLPPDPSKGDERTIGGYMAVHARPAAFQGSDGISYSVAIEAQLTGEPDRPYGAYFLFVRWRRLGAQGVEGHLESPFLAYGTSPDAARESLGGMSLEAVKAILDELIAAAAPAPPRKWWDVMRDEDQ
ncbi:MAG TPA: hypothetical protein VFZ73_14250 [Gemmatimonadaceae bacterium]